MKQSIAVLVLCLTILGCREETPLNLERGVRAITFSLPKPASVPFDSAILILRKDGVEKRVELGGEGSTLTGIAESIESGDWQSSIRIFLTGNSCSKRILKLDRGIEIGSEPSVMLPGTTEEGWEEFYYHQINDDVLHLTNVEIFTSVNACDFVAEIHFNGNAYPHYAYWDRAYWTNASQDEQVGNYQWGETLSDIQSDVITIGLGTTDAALCESPDWGMADSYLILAYGGTEKTVGFCWEK